MLRVSKWTSEYPFVVKSGWIYGVKLILYEHTNRNLPVVLVRFLSVD